MVVSRKNFLDLTPGRGQQVASKDYFVDGCRFTVFYTRTVEEVNEDNNREEEATD